MPFSYGDIDIQQLIQNLSEGDGSIMFESRLQEDCYLKSTFTALMNRKPEKWNAIKLKMQGEYVDITYSDRYLVKPISCLLLAHFVSALSTKLNVTIRTFNIQIAAPKDEDYYTDNPLSVDDNFYNKRMQKDFLGECIYAITGVHPNIEIKEWRYLEHARCMTVKTNSQELSIRPDGGVGYGWKKHIFERALTNEDFEDDWDLDMKMYNQSKSPGILYTISFKKS